MGLLQAAPGGGPAVLGFPAFSICSLGVGSAGDSRPHHAVCFPRSVIEHPCHRVAALNGPTGSRRSSEAQSSYQCAVGQLTTFHNQGL